MLTTPCKQINIDQKLPFFDQGIQFGVPRHHESDVDYSPMSSDPVASDEVGLAPAVVDNSAQAPTLLAVAEYTADLLFVWREVRRCRFCPNWFHFLHDAGASGDFYLVCDTCRYLHRALSSDRIRGNWTSHHPYCAFSRDRARDARTR